MTAGSPPSGEPSGARQVVDEHVSAGRWPDPNERPCDDCGHVWFRGERAHAYDVDHLERPAKNAEEVNVVCVLCHRQRSFDRAEETAGAWRTHW